MMETIRWRRGLCAALLAALGLVAAEVFSQGAPQSSAIGHRSTAESRQPATTQHDPDEQKRLVAIVGAAGPVEHDDRNALVVRSRQVEIDADVLHHAAATIDARPVVMFELFDGVNVPLEVMRITSRGEFDYSLHARIPRVLGGFATITVRGDRVVGFISVPRVGKYRILPSRDGLHRVNEVNERDTTCGIDQALFPFRAPHLQDDDGELPPMQQGEPIVVRVYVVFTELAEETAADNGDDIVQIIQSDVDTLNEILTNSETNVLFKLVATDQVDYAESGEMSDDLAALRDTDIFLEGSSFATQHTMRTTHCADFVAMIVSYEPGETDICGIAYLMTVPSPTQYNVSAFSVTRIECMPGFTFAHELGHNMGCHHDHVSTGGVGGTYPYSFGHKYLVDAMGLTPDDDMYATVMSYPPFLQRVPYFSNPLVQYPPGFPTGVQYGLPNPADNALTIINNAPHFRLFSQMIGGFDCIFGTDIHVPDDYPTIQEAIFAAEDGDVIFVAPGVYQEKIDLLGKLITVRSHDPHDPAVVAATIIDGLHPITNVPRGPVITCSSNEGPRTVINGFTIRNGGNVPRGGGMFIHNSSPSVANCVFVNNQASIAGGGVYIEGGNPSISRCTFDSNTSSNRGGGLASRNANPLIFSSTFTSNNAVANGGGMHVDGGSPLITGGQSPQHLNHFHDNFAGHAGGGLYARFSSLSMSDALFEMNSATYLGGGIYFSQGSPTLQRVTIEQNIANILGGGVYSDFSSPSISESTIVDNTALSRGGGFYIFGGSPTISESTISNNTASNGSEGQGGGLYLMDTTLEIIDSFITVNTAGTSGGGIFVFVDEEEDEEDWIRPALQESILCQNTPNNITGPWDDLGGNFICAGEADTFVCHDPGDCNDPPAQCNFNSIQAAINSSDPGDTIVVCPGVYFEAIDFDGRPVHVRSEDPSDPDVVAATIIDGQGQGTVVKFINDEEQDSILNGFTITGGSAITGGGIRIQNSSPTIENCVLQNNSAGSVGGGLAAMQSDAIIRNCRFLNNTANTGGGMYTETSAGVSIQNCTFEGNHANNSGGGLANFLATGPTIDNAMFEANTAGIRGGAIYNASNSSPLIVNSSIRSNSSAQGGGGVHSTDSSQALVSQTLFCDNSPAHIQGPWVNLGNVTFVGICPPLNNLPSTAQAVDGETATIIGSFVGATNDGSASCEPDGVDVFYSYNVNVPGAAFTVDTCDSGDNTALAIFDPVGNEIGCNDNCNGLPCGGPDACLTVTPPVPGTYLIRVSQVPSTLANQPPGTFTLNFGKAPALVPGDLNHDGVVDGADLLILLSEWGDCPPQPSACSADLNNDGTVDSSDLLILLSNWG